MRGLLVAGTTSDAGKSVVTAGTCRWLARQGVKVAPFKAQNMSLNSAVGTDRAGGWAEIGRAQVMQAAAAGVEPEAAMNPVLLKPGGEGRSQVVLRGRPLTEAGALDYQQLKPRLMAAVLADLEDLAARHDVVVCEGAGSPAEINLRVDDIVNMGLARAAGLPVVVVGDIDRGGVSAAMYGTLALLDAADQAHLAGWVVNKFRGDEQLLRPGLDALHRVTGRPVLGVLPWLPGLWLDAEDSLDLTSGSLRPATALARGDTLTVAVAALPRLSNATDLDALAVEPGVDVRLVDRPADFEAADLAVLPGTRATVADLAWLRERGLADAVRRRAAAGRAVLGLCGGYQMLARTITDDVESGAGTVEGLALLPASVRFGAGKVLDRPVGEALGERVEGYEIHHGVVEVEGGEPFLDGCAAGAVRGTSWHGILENDGFRRAFLARVAAECGRAWLPRAVSFAEVREARLDALGDLVADSLDTTALMRLIDGGPPVGLPSVPPGAPCERGGPVPEAVPTTVPDDGLTTRERRELPLLAVHTGDMKGKSTAAFGMALRAWSAGLPVAVFQFVKSGKWRVGEQAAFTALGRVHEQTGEGAPVVWHTMGAGWSWQRKQGTDVDHAAQAREGWAQVKRDLAAQAYGFYVLDEFTYPMTWGWVDVDDVVETLVARPGRQHVVVTGRGADPRLVDAADLVLETHKVKHPMDAGRLGQRGIEW